MSYYLNVPCYNCKKCQTTSETEGKCKDAEKLSKAVVGIHGATFEQGHQGAGIIVLSCCKLDPKT